MTEPKAHIAGIFRALRSGARITFERACFCSLAMLTASAVAVAFLIASAAAEPSMRGQSLPSVMTN